MKTKVLMIEHYSPDSIYTNELCQELKKHIDLTLLSRRDSNIKADGFQIKKGLYHGGKGKITALFYYLKALLSTIYTIMHGHYDIIHIQTFKFPSIEIPIYLKMKKYCGKMVSTVHNVLPHEADSRDVELYRAFYQNCDLLICHNQSTKIMFKEAFPNIDDCKLAVIPHGSYNVRLLPKAPTGKTEFLMFGLVRQYKGIDILIQAVEKLPDEIKEQTHFIIAGNHDKKMDSTDYQSMAKIGDFTFINRKIPDEELPELYRNVDFCIFPYRNIYGSGALLMSYSYQKPVIVSNIMTFREEAKGCGLFFSSEDPVELARAITTACNLSEEEYRSFQSNIDKELKEKFNWAKSALKTSQTYLNIL